MIDGNELRAEFGRYLHEHRETRWGMDAALMHVCTISYNAGLADAKDNPAPEYCIKDTVFDCEIQSGLSPIKILGLPDDVPEMKVLSKSEKLCDQLGEALVALEKAFVIAMGDKSPYSKFALEPARMAIHEWKESK
jgi:hypothetical protein